MSFNGDLYPTAGADVVMTTKGDMVDYNTARQRLGIGSANQILQVKSGLPSWETLSTAGSVLTTQGSILYENASGLAELGFGTTGDVLTTKGTGANPVWETPATGLSSPLSSNLVWDDNVEANFGSGGGDSYIKHDGSNMYIKPITGGLFFQGNVHMIQNTCFTFHENIVTISSGTFTGNNNSQRVAVETGSSDDLDSANYGGVGQNGSPFVLIAYNSNTVNVIDESGVSPNFYASGDFSLDHITDTITFLAFQGLGANYELSRSNNA